MLEFSFSSNVKVQVVDHGRVPDLLDDWEGRIGRIREVSPAGAGIVEDVGFLPVVTGGKRPEECTV